MGSAFEIGVCVSQVTPVGMVNTEPLDNSMHSD